MTSLGLLIVVMGSGFGGCGGNPDQLWLAGDPANELVTFLVDREPEPY